MAVKDPRALHLKLNALLFAVMGLDKVRSGYLSDLSEVDRAFEDLKDKTVKDQWNDVKSSIVAAIRDSENDARLRGLSKLAATCRALIIVAMLAYTVLIALSVMNPSQWLWLTIHPAVFLPAVVVLPQVYMYVNTLIRKQFRVVLLPLDGKVKALTQRLILKLGREIGEHGLKPDDYPMKLTLGDYENIEFEHKPRLVRRFFIATVKPHRPRAERRGDHARG